jgi:hypothetical protein
VFACRRCGRIWAPANDPGTCPCGQPTKRYDVRVAMRMNKARHDQLRERARLRAERRRQVAAARGADAARGDAREAGD